MDEPYRLARDTILYAEIVTNELQHRGFSELRDVIEHVNRALFIEDEGQALRDLDSAFEHIRRGAVESIQYAATKTLYETLEIININSILLRLTCLDKVSRRELIDYRMNARKCLVDGRAKKSSPDTWVEAIQHFSDCIEMSLEIQSKFPEKSVIKWRLLTLLGIIVTVGSFLFAIWAVFFK